jgi:hypothetical protein
MCDGTLVPVSIRRRHKEHNIWMAQVTPRVSFEVFVLEKLMWTRPSPFYR